MKATQLPFDIAGKVRRIIAQLDARTYGEGRYAQFLAEGEISLASSLLERLARLREQREYLAAAYWHGTHWSIPGDRFRPFTHFGTMRQAALGVGMSKDLADAARDLEHRGVQSDAPQTREPVIYEVRLIMRRPLRISDGGQHHDPDVIASLIDDVKTLPAELSPDVEREPDRSMKVEMIVRALVSSGFDGLIYQNSIEGAGSDSVMILSYRQVVVSHVHSSTSADFDIHRYLQS